MSISRPFAYNTGASIAGTTQVGNLAVGTPTSGFTGMEWWNGPNELLGWVIAESVSGDTQPTPISGVTASVGFFRTPTFTDSSFISLANKITNQSYTTATQASSGLTSLGYWNSYSETWPSTDIRFIGLSTKTFSGNWPISFTNVNVGSASTIYQSLLVILAGISEASGQALFTSIKAGGQECTLAIQNQFSSGDYQHKALYYIPWNSNSGTTTTITLSGTGVTPPDGLDIAIYRLDNVRNATPQFTYRNQIATQENSWTFSGMQIGDLVIGGVGTEIGNVLPNWNWTGLTENFDTRYQPINTNYYISGANTRITTNGNQTFNVRNLSITGPGTEYPWQVVSAVWR